MVFFFSFFKIEILRLLFYMPARFQSLREEDRGDREMNLLDGAKYLQVWRDSEPIGNLFSGVMYWICIVLASSCMLSTDPSGVSLL